MLPVGSASTSSCGMIGGVPWELCAASLNTRIVCAWSIAPGAQSRPCVGSMTLTVCADAGGIAPLRKQMSERLAAESPGSARNMMFLLLRSSALDEGGTHPRLAVRAPNHLRRDGTPN